jgi:hypothetical protein
MRSAYRVLAILLAALVVVQAAAIAFAVAGLEHWVDEGNTLDKASAEDADFQGVVGFMIHGMNGMMLIPLVALLLLIVSFFAKIPGGVQRAAIVLVLVIVQVTLGLFGHDIPVLGGLHGLNALLVFSSAVMAAVKAKEPVVEAPYTAEQARV